MNNKNNNKVMTENKGQITAPARTIEGTRISYRQSEIHKDYLSTLATNNQRDALDPNYITGFADGEASFKISIYKKIELKIG